MWGNFYIRLMPCKEDLSPPPPMIKQSDINMQYNVDSFDLKERPALRDAFNTPQRQ